ncbi:MAG: MFS transporter [Hyphomicrobiaceae bacterium]|nr:MFS transporter [Hyphomicrobiaceae bacterium]
MTERADRKAIFSWMLYDWASQPYHTLIVTFIFAPYFTAYVADSAVSGQTLWGYAAATGGVLVALMAPVFGAMVDASGPRKPWIALFSILLVVGCAFLFFATPGGTAPVFWILAAFVVATIGVEMTTIFTNAMMPTLVPRADLGKLSGSGWALGYVGGLIALIFMLTLMSADAETGKTLIGISPIFGLDPATYEGDRASGPLSAIWYLVFILPLFFFTPDAPRTPNAPSISEGLKGLWQTLKSLPTRGSYFTFLITSMLYRDGLNALYAFGGIYAAGVLKMSIIQIGIFGILAAITGAIGAFVGGRLDARFGPRPVVFVSCWLLVLASLLVVSTTPDVTLFTIPISEGTPTIIFYIAGMIIGAAGGTLQAASRTLLVDQVGKDETTEAFGLYALTGKATSFIGPFLVAIVTSISQSQRIGITPIIVLLAIGALGLYGVRQYGDK